MSEEPLNPGWRTRANKLQRQSYAREASKYDGRAECFERWFFGTEHRGWACSRAIGDTLEVAIGTGRNLPYYPADVRLIGIDLTPEMLAVARTSAQRIGRAIGLLEGDAHGLPFVDSSFDSVVCTYALCSVPDEARAISEMKRVLKPGGRLILVDHVRSSVEPIFWLQRLYELIPSRARGGYVTRRPALKVMEADFDIRVRDRFRAGIVERLVAVKPGEQSDAGGR